MSQVLGYVVLASVVGVLTWALVKAAKNDRVRDRLEERRLRRYVDREPDVVVRLRLHLGKNR